MIGGEVRVVIQNGRRSTFSQHYTSPEPAAARYEQDGDYRGYDQDKIEGCYLGIFDRLQKSGERLDARVPTTAARTSMSKHVVEHNITNRGSIPPNDRPQ